MNTSKLMKNQELIRIIRKFRKNFSSAVIAGGAIRDIYHGKPIHDIDIYVNESNVNPYSQDTWKTEFDLRTTAISENYIRKVGSEDYSGKNHIGAVWEMQKHNKLYNIIVVDIDPIEYVTKWFDIGLCKAYCDGTKIRFTADFMHDSRSKKLTIVSKNMDETEFWNMMCKHATKLRRKYPQHSLVVPPMYQEWYDTYLKNT